MMQPRWIGLAGVWIGLTGCTPPATSTTSGAPPAKQVEAPPAKVEPAVPVEPKVPTPSEPATPGETLDGRALVTSDAGGWSVRRLGPGGGGSRADVEESVAAPPSPKGSSVAFEEGRSGGGGRTRRGDGGPALGGSGGAPTAEAKKPGKPGGGEAPLKAGSTDDNADFKGYLKFLETWTSREDVRGEFQPLDVAGRVFVTVVDGDKRPLPGVAVTVSEPLTKVPLWQATTYGDGRAPYYPKLFGPAVQADGRLEVSATIGGATVAATWDGQSDVTLAAPGPVTPTPLALDVVFLLDTTGSMGDELERIKTSLLAVTDKLKAKRADLDLRYGAVAYKDVNDDYVTMAHPLTADAAAFSAAMQALSAGGGGDLPESLNQGLARAVEGLEWRPAAAKVVFLVADAAPQMRLKGDTLYGDSGVKAVGRGIRVHAVAASGLDPLGTLVLRQIAQLTRGKFIFIEYGSTQQTAASHGVSGPVEGGNNLDEILLKQLTAEIEGWGR